MRRSTRSALYALGAAAAGAAAIGSPWWIASAFLVAFAIVGGGAWFGRSRKVSDRWDTVATGACLSVGR